MVSSHSAHWRIAPKPVFQKYLPERMELLHGVHDGAGTKALVKSTPSLAIRSKAGVRR